MIVIRTNLAVCIGLKSKKLCIFAFIVHSLNPYFGNCCCALCIICYDLCYCKSWLVNFTVDQECRNSGIICLLNSFDWSICTSVIADDCCCSVIDSCFEKLKLCSSVIIMGRTFHFISKLFCLLFCNYLFCVEERIGCGRCNAINNVASATRK